MSEQLEQPKKRSMAVRILLLPLLPWRATWRSMKTTVGSGAKTIRDINEQIQARRRNPKVRTFAEAMARRPADAIPLEQIAATCLWNKRIALFFWLLSLAYTVGSLIPQNYIGAVLGVLFSAFCILIALKFQHQLWQIRTGSLHPKRPLGSIRDYLRAPGWLGQLLDPEFFG